MEKEEKKKFYENKRVLIIAIVVLLLTVAGMAFAYYFAVLKGKNVNIAKTADVSLTYTEPSESVTASQVDDLTGMTGNNSYNFSVTGTSSGTASLTYLIYAEEEDGNTLNSSDIMVYLTNDNDEPTNTYITDLDEGFIYDSTGDGISYTYTSDISYSITNSSSEEVSTGEINKRENEEFVVEKQLLRYYAEAEEENELKVFMSSGDSENPYDCKLFNASDDTLEDAQSGCGSLYITAYDNPVVLSDSNQDVLFVAEYTESETKLTIQDTSSNYDLIHYVAFELLHMDENLEATNYVAYGTNMLGAGSSSFVKNSCTKLTMGEGEAKPVLVEEEAPLSSCANGYTIVDQAAMPVVLGSLDNVFNNHDVSNIIEMQHMMFSPVGKGQGKDILFDNNTGTITANYKLHYWVNGAIGESSAQQETTEVTSTDNGNTHTVNFGSTDQFRFKVNVFALKR